jgi:site-specific recombinase XerD
VAIRVFAEKTMAGVLGEYERWLIHKGRMESTARYHYERLLRVFQHLEEVGVVEVRDITSEIIPVVETWMMDQGQSPGTRRNYLAALKGFFNYLTDQGHLLFDLSSKITSPRTKKIIRRVPSPDDVRRLINTVDTSKHHGRRDRLLIELAYYTGMRAGELSSLMWSQINFRERSIRFIGKGDAERIVYFPESIRQSLQSFQNETASHHVFGGIRGDNLSTRVTYWSKKAGLDFSGIHFLRYAIATHLYEAGANVRTIQVMLGHKNLSSTYEYILPRVDYLREIHQKHHPFQRGFL